MLDLSVNLPFRPPATPMQFTAVGYLFGKFTPIDDPPASGPVKGLLELEDGMVIDALIPRKFWLNLTQKKQDFDFEGSYLWRLYPRTTKEGKLTSLELLRVILSEDLSTKASGRDYFLIRGCLTQKELGTAVLKIERNFQPKEKQAKFRWWKPFLLTLIGSLPQANPGQFWECYCHRKGACLSIEQAKLIESNVEKQTSSSSGDNKNTREGQSTQPQPVNELIMIQGRQPEITIKFSQRPNLPETGKKVSLQVTGENGILVRAELNRKTLKKQVEKMDSFAEWVGALSGKIASVSAEGMIVLEAAGVTVFEKKAKQSEPSPGEPPATPASTDSPPSRPKKTFNLAQ